MRINEYKAPTELKKAQRGLTLSSTTTSGSTSYLATRRSSNWYRLGLMAA
ncbi:hypothetical protein [Atopobium sp. oral taxon 416]|nr:hypothetical protein [Atopobium sp. oral taxon 416]QUC04335.1 hypothetical protein J4859_05215 [Atopobium sp. oral taxon 416]